MGESVYRSENLAKDLIANFESKDKNVNLSDSDIKYLLLNNAEEMSASFVKKSELDNIVNQAVNNLITEYEKKASETYNIIDINRSKQEIVPKLLNSVITLENYEDIFCLNEFIAFEIPSFDENTRSIRYKDFEGNTVAIVQIDNNSNKIRLQAVGNFLPKQDYIPPKLINYRLSEKSKKENWTSEDGGINQFDGNIETRYKDAEGNVMAAVIVKPGGKADTVVEYVYENGRKAQMLHTSQYGHSKTFYDTENNSAKLVIDIDTDGNICGVVKGFSV